MQIINAEHHKRERTLDKLRRDCGAPLLEALADDNVTGLYINDDGYLWLNTRQGKQLTETLINTVQARSIIDQVASFNNQVINDSHPRLAAQFPLGKCRFQAFIPPLSRAPLFVLRKPAIKVYSLDEYCAQNLLTVEQLAVLKTAIQQRQSILIVGGMDSGKTTFANALLNEMTQHGAPHRRIAILEGQPELQCSAPNTLYLCRTETIDFNSLLHDTLRTDAEIICIGECRGAEMYTLLKAWNTGNPGGLTTLHANSAKDALSRVCDMIQEAGVAPSPRLISTAVDLIVSLQKDPVTQCRRVQDVLRIAEFNAVKQEFIFESVT